MPSIGHVLHLAQGQEVYQGTRQDYDPEAVAKAVETLDSAETQNSKIV